MRTTQSCLVILVLAWFANTPAVAQPPDLLREYQFVTRHSTLTVEGGIAGFYFELPIYGSFDFVTGFENHFPSLDPYASFFNVDAEAINPTDFGPYSFDIDQSLNLSGLKGEPQPANAPFDLYRFEGTDGQGAPMELYVATLGRWLYMKGENSPGCCDFFLYEISALARQKPFPDFNSDGSVDHHDLSYWEAHTGVDDGADADGNGMTDGNDFLALQREYGSTPPAIAYFDALIDAALTSGGLAATVPEPSSVSLLAIGLLALWRRPQSTPDRPHSRSV